MTGKAPREITATDYFRKINNLDTRTNARLRSMRTPLNVAVPIFGSSPSSSTVGISGNFLATGGGSMIGRLALLNRQVIININNQIDISELSTSTITNESNYTSNLLFDLLNSASTQLDTIVGAFFSGDILILKGPGLSQTITQRITLNIDNIVGNGTDNIITVTVADGSALATNNKVNIVGAPPFDKNDVVITKTGTNTFTYDLGSIGSATPVTTGQIARGNIQTQDGNNIVVTGADTFQSWIAIFDEIVSSPGGQGVWRIIAGTNALSGTGGVAFPIDFLEEDKGSPGATSTIDFDAVTRHYVKITLTEDHTVTFLNLPAAGTSELCTIRFVQNSAGNHTVTFVPALANTVTVGSTGGETTDVFIKNSFGLLTGNIEGAKIFVGSDASQWSTFDAVQVVNFANFAANNVGGITLNGGDINFNTQDGNNLDRLLFSQTAGSPLISTTTGITSNAAGDLLFNTPANTKYNFFSNGFSILALDNSSTELSLSLFARDNETPILQLTRIDSTPSVGAQIGRVIFAGVDSSGSTIEEFARIQVDSADLTVGSVDGTMHLQVDKNNTTTAFISLNNSNDNKISLWNNPQLQPGVNFELNSNRLLMTTGASTTFIKGDATSVGMFVSDAASAKGTFGTTRLILKNDYFLQSQAVELRNVTSDLSSPINGTTWYNSTLNKFRGQENGSAVDMISSAGSSITAGDSNVTVTDTGSGLIQNVVDGTNRFQIQATRADFSTIPVFGITNLTFFDSTSTIGGILTTNASSFDISVPEVGDVISITNTGITTANFTNTDLQLLSRTPNTLSAGLRLFRNDPSPAVNDVLGVINFDGNDSAAAFQEYAKIICTILDPVSPTGRLTIRIAANNLDTPALIIDPGELSVNKFSSVTAETSTLNLRKEDATPVANDSIGAMNFQLFDSPTTITYASIDSQIKDVTDSGILSLKVRADNSALTTGLQLTGDNSVSSRSYLTVNARINSSLGFGFEGGGSNTFRISPVGASTKLSIVIGDNASYTDGSEGTFAPPFTNTEPTSDADADSRFGTHKGAMGISRETAITSAHKVWSRDDNGKWGFTNVTNAF